MKEVQVDAEECGAIDGVSPDPGQEVHGNVAFLDEACLKGEVVSDKTWWSIFKQEPRFDVADVFARPHLLSTGTWVDTSLVQFSQMLRVDTITGNPLWGAHLYGRSLLRATWCFRVEVSNSPFMGGWLRLSHIPQRYTNSPGSYSQALTRYRQLPGVDLNISTHTSAVLRIPHRTIDPWFRLDVATPAQNNGWFVLWRRTPLNLGDGAAPRFSVWFWLEDVEIAGNALPVSLRGPVVPQAGGQRASAGRVSALAAQGRAQLSGESKQEGPLSAFLNSGSRVLETYGSKIPLLSAYASPLSWAARMAGKVAAAYGFSKPLNQQPIGTIKKLQFGPINATGVEVGYVMATAHDTQVPPVPVTGDQLDSMTVAFLAQQLFPLCEVRVPDTTPANALLTAGLLGPSAMMRHPAPGKQCPSYMEYGTSLLQPPSSTVGVSSLVPSAALWLSSWFTYWRGAIRFRLLFSKTKMVSGRVAFVWNYDYQSSYHYTTPPGPFVGPSPNIRLPASLVTGHVDNKVIIDLRESSDVEVVVPFFSPVPLCSVLGGIGSWGLYMLDPINHPASTASYIDVAVEASFTEEFFVAGPRQSNFVPDDSGGPVLAQAGREQDAVTAAAALRSFSAPSNADLVAATVGEDVKSLKQLALCTHLYSVGSVPLNVWCCPEIKRDANNQYVPPLVNSIFGHLRRMYTVERGGLVVTFSYNGAGSDRRITVSPQDLGGGALVAPPNFPWVTDTLSENPRFVLPRYAPLGASYNRQAPVSDPYVTPVSGVFLDGTYRQIPAQGDGVNVFMSAADDYMVSQFLATVPMVVSFFYTKA